MRTVIKITLNSSSVFDAAIIDFLKGKKNKAGQLKRLAFERLVSLQSSPQTVKIQEGVAAPVSEKVGKGNPQPLPDLAGHEEKSGIDEALINQKLDKLSQF